MKNTCFSLSIILSISFIPLVSGYNIQAKKSVDIALSDNVNMKYKSSKDGFEIALSCDPEIREEPVSDLLYGNYNLVQYLCESSNGLEGVSVSRYPDKFVQNHDERETVRGCIQGYEAGYNINIITSNYTFDGKIGKLAKFNTNGMYLVAGIVFIKGKLFQVIMLRLDGYPTDNEISQFMGSFKTI